MRFLFKYSTYCPICSRGFQKLDWFYFSICNHFTFLVYQYSLYRGKVGLDVAEAQHLLDGLDWKGAVKDIQASVNWLKANGSKKVWSDLCFSSSLCSEMLHEDLICTKDKTERKPTVFLSFIFLLTL